MGGGGSKPRPPPPPPPRPPPPPPPPPIPRPAPPLPAPPPGGYDKSVMRRNKKFELITSLRGEREKRLRNVIDSLRGKRLQGKYHKYLSFDGKDYWLYLSIGNVPPGVSLGPPPSAKQSGIVDPIITASSSSTPTTKNYITVYTGVDYRGVSRKYPIGQHKSIENTFARKIRSIQVPSGRRVTVYNEANLKGTSTTFTQNISNLEHRKFVIPYQSLHWSNRIQSMVVV